ncbi:MAG TPA: hypothetical protein VMT34_05055, partial [Aggregatilineales bacterium]|nr:hypothetical protein [Aggregatilineales bacterium]
MDTFGSLLTPWLILAAVLIPLIYVEKWIHAHLYGVGWLLTNNKKSATALYYVLLFPGVFVHEFTQYLVAGALNVRIKRVIAWPEAQDDGTLRLNFVQIKQAHWMQAAVIGAAPLFTGLSIIWVISNQILNLDNVLSALATANITVIGPALQELVSKPDFYLWLYLMFTVSNAMLPTPADREGWPLVVVSFAVVIGFLVVIGTGAVLLRTFTGPVAHGVERLAAAFATVLAVEIPGLLVIGLAEEILKRITKREFQYGEERMRSGATRQPGSSDPLPLDAPMPSIYNLPLPVPVPSEAPAHRAPPTPTPAPAQPAPADASQRPTAPPAPGGEQRPAPQRAPGGPGAPLPSPRPERQPVSAAGSPAVPDRGPSRLPGSASALAQTDRPSRPAGASGPVSPEGESPTGTGSLSRTQPLDRPAFGSLGPAQTAARPGDLGAPTGFPEDEDGQEYGPVPGTSERSARRAFPDRPALSPRYGPATGEEDLDEELEEDRM